MLKRSIQSKELDFSTVKVVFHKKLTFYIPTMINFYIKLKTMNLNNKLIETKEFSFDFSRRNY